MKLKITLNKLIILGCAISFGILILFFTWWYGTNTDIIITNEGEYSEIKSSSPKSSLAGLACDNYNRRPVAIMLAGDPETRPLSGISEADLVIEMPVTPTGINRMMAIFQCGNPGEIGSIRSAREDFIPLVNGFGAIYAHWGGEREALEKLNGHIVDNVDGLKFDGTVFFRKKEVPMPHNGFTTLDRLIEQSKKFNYSLEDKFLGFKHEEREQTKNLNNINNEIVIDYPTPYNVRWVYDQEKGEYKRFRNNRPEIDRNTNEQVSARVVIIMETGWKYLSQDYIRVDTQGTGDVLVYQGGTVQSGRWDKNHSSMNSPLIFYGTDNKEIIFLPGKKWLEIVIK